MADGKGFDFDPGHRVLITGGAGFVGSHLADALLAQGCHVHVIDNLSAGRRENLPASRDNFTFEEGDVGETYPAPGPLGAAVGKADFVFHLASPIGVMLAHSHRFEVTSRILREGLAVVEACAAHRKPLLFTSSSEVYGMGKPAPIKESDVAALGLEPRWGYGAAKFALEHLVQSLTHKVGVPTWIVRFFNVAGGRQRPESGLCIPAFVHAALDGGEIIVHDKGEQQRAFVHVKDAAAGLLSVATCEDLVNQPVNLGSPDPITIRAVAERVVALVNPEANIAFKSSESVFGENFASADLRAPDITLLSTATNWKPRYTLDDIIVDCRDALDPGA